MNKWIELELQNDTTLFVPLKAITAIEAGKNDYTGLPFLIVYLKGLSLHSKEVGDPYYKDLPKNDIEVVYANNSYSALKFLLMAGADDGKSKNI